jgi:hypothetical protein
MIELRGPTTKGPGRAGEKAISLASFLLIRTDWWKATSVPCTESRAEQSSLQNMTESATADDSGATRAMELCSVNLELGRDRFR